MRIDPLVARQLQGGTLIALDVLADQLHQAPHIVLGWARQGVRGHRLPAIVLAGRRYTTLQACHRFVAHSHGSESPFE